MLFKSDKFFDLKSKKALLKLVIQKLISLKTCDHTVEYSQLSINLCQFFNFLLHATGKNYHFLRFNYLEMGQVDFPELSETTETTEMTENFAKVTK